MNSRQKLVQQQFLNNEEKVINRLKWVYNKSVQDVNDTIKNLQFKIDELQTEYDWLDDNDPEKEKIRSKIQSKIYQKQYQEQLKSQLDGILDRMQAQQFTTVSEYLDECYVDGFIGTVFDAHGQGVPIIAPINQEAMVRAVQLESKISVGLYTRLGENIAKLKKRIASQVSRGISSGMSYAQVAQQLEGCSKFGYNRAITIARTEGHRIQTTATMDAMTAAKEKGADVVKQWDSTLDDVTRESHRQVDGEIRELDKPFSNGLDFPGDPAGGPAEVICCRCALLQRARWALDDDELQILKDRAEYYELDKSTEFEDFKKKYLKATENPVDKSGENGIIKGRSNGNGSHSSEHSFEKIGKVNFNDKNAINTAMNDFEKMCKDSEIEHCRVITVSGDVYDVHGDSDTVDTTLLGDKMRGSINSHNHVTGRSQYSFSKEDIYSSVEDGSRISSAFDEKYKYSMEFNVAVTEDDVYNAYNEATMTVMNRKIFVGDVTDEDEQHEIVKETCRILGIKYERAER